MESKETSLSGSSSLKNSFTIAIDSDHGDARLDQFLARVLLSVSRTLITHSIRKGLVLVDGVSRKNSYRLKRGQIVTGSIFELPGIDVEPEKIDFPVLYEDDSLLLISKPPGLVVHPGSGNHSGTLVNGLVYYCQAIAGAGDTLRPGIVHRLDKDTSGVMVIAKKDKIHRILVDYFKNRLLEKEYIALVHGILKVKTGRLAAAIGRHPVHRQKMAVRPGTGRHAVSNWEVVDEFSGKMSLVKVNIETGRTHQIRVHMAYKGHPVVGDVVYGSQHKDDSVSRQLLHASRLVFKHPVTTKKMDIRAPLWQDFSDILEGLGWSQKPEYET
jgi:23S rRNA pseudouridine1911/1915/1917 synthase